VVKGVKTTIMGKDTDVGFTKEASGWNKKNN
jgi:hypothetical protein